MARLLWLLSSVTLLQAQLISYVPSSNAASTLPLYALAKFQIPVILDDTGAPTSPLYMFAGDKITITDDNIAVGTIPNGPPLAAGWTNFVANAGTTADAPVNGLLTDDLVHDIVFTTQDLPLLQSVSTTTGAPPDTVTTTIGQVPCVGTGRVDPTGRILTVTLVNTFLQATVTTTGAGTVPDPLPTTACWLDTNYQWEMFINQRYLSPIPPAPQQMTFLSISFTQVNDIVTLTDPLTYPPVAGAPLVAPIVFGPYQNNVPWTSTVAQLGISTLRVIKYVPETTLMGQTPKFATATIILGAPVSAGGYISMEFDYFSVQAPTQNTYASIGYNCAAIPRLCCSQSLIKVNDIGAYWKSITFQLGPQGCMLPKDKVITFVIPGAAMEPIPAFGIVDTFNHLPNYRLWTSSEPMPTNCQRFAEPMTPSTNAVSFYKSSAANQLTPATNGGVGWCSNVVGTSYVSAFAAVPSTTTTGVSPDVTISITLNVVNFPAIAAGAFSVNGIVISANLGVFAFNQGTKLSPRQLQVLSPVECSGISQFYTNAYATLILLMNPTSGNIVAATPADACRTALTSGATITVVIPASIVLPNLPPTDVSFDVRIAGPDIDPANVNGDVNVVDSATLMDVFGWRTTVTCSSTLIGAYGSFLTDIPNQPVADRCGLVNWINKISPVSGGLLQCPVTGGFYSWIKVPEGSPNLALNWPTATAPNTYPIVVSAPGSPIIAILSFGWIIDSPMFAVVVVYPATAQSLLNLGINNAALANACSIGFIIRMDRLTESCQTLGIVNPWEMRAAVGAYPIVDVLYYGALFVAGTSVNTLAPNGGWASSNGYTMVTVPADGLVVGYTTCLVSPIPDDGSDDALFGLLALIAIPVLLCSCLLALLWFCRPKKEACPCVPEYPVQEMYWVNAQPCAPACGSYGPASTPVYLVQ